MFYELKAEGYFIGSQFHVHDVQLMLEEATSERIHGMSGEKRAIGYPCRPVTSLRRKMGPTESSPINSVNILA